MEQIESNLRAAIDSFREGKLGDAFDYCEDAYNELDEALAEQNRKE